MPGWIVLLPTAVRNASSAGPRPPPRAQDQQTCNMFENTTHEVVRILLWMALPILAGWLLWRVLLRKRAGGHAEASFLGRHATRLALLFTATPIMLLASWIAPLPGGKGLLLPLVGLSVHVVGTATGWSVARLSGQPAARRAAFLLGGGCSNVLTFGGISVVFLMRSTADPNGEQAIAEMTLYRMFELPYYFLVAWPLAASIAQTDNGPSQPWRAFLASALCSPAVAPVIGLVVGLTLNLAKVERPEFFDGSAAILVRLNVSLLGATVGLSLRRSKPLAHVGSCLTVAGIKFLVMPLVGIGLAWGFGYRGTTLQIVTICSAMPVAFMAVVGAAYYNLDEGLVGSFWLFTTAAMVVVIPLLAYVLPQIG